jgi:hypothetical protein
MLQGGATAPQPCGKLLCACYITQEQLQRGEGGKGEVVPAAADTRDDAKPVALIQLLPSLQEQGLSRVCGKRAEEAAVNFCHPCSIPRKMRLAHTVFKDLFSKLL